MNEGSIICQYYQINPFINLGTTIGGEKIFGINYRINSLKITIENGKNYWN